MQLTWDDIPKREGAQADGWRGFAPDVDAARMLDSVAFAPVCGWIRVLDTCAGIDARIQVAGLQLRVCGQDPPRADVRLVPVRDGSCRSIDRYPQVSAEIIRPCAPTNNSLVSMTPS